MCPPRYNHFGFVATLALGHKMNCASCAEAHEFPQSHCGDNREAYCLHDYIYTCNMYM